MQQTHNRKEGQPIANKQIAIDRLDLCEKPSLGAEQIAANL